MITIRKSEDRGHADFGWLDSRHTFSFGEYHDPRHMGFRTLRVINDDLIAGGQGFGTHPHRDMEIISYVVDGALEHRDSMGNGDVIRRGEVQVMTAGSGITHSEFNPEPDTRTRLLQIWIMPEARGLKPRYDQKLFPDAEKRNRLRLLVSRDGRDGSLAIHQDVLLFASLLDAGAKVERGLAPGRHAWLQVVTGGVDFNGTQLAHGDGAAISDESRLAITAATAAEILLFDLA